jgi:hypothetical protein
MRVYPKKKTKKSISFSKSKSNSKNSRKSPSRPYPQANVKTEYFYRNTGRNTTYSRTNIPKENIRKSKTKSKSKSKTRREYRNKHQQGKFNPNPRSRHTRKQPSPKKQTPKQPKKQTPKQPKKQTHIPSRNLSPLLKKNGVVINSINEPNDALSILKLPTDKTPTRNELIKAYRKRALLLHPDKHKNSKLATDKFKQLTNAYEFLKLRFNHN